MKVGSAPIRALRFRRARGTQLHMRLDGCLFGGLALVVHIAHEPGVVSALKYVAHSRFTICGTRPFFSRCRRSTLSP